MKILHSGLQLALGALLVVLPLAAPAAAGWAPDDYVMTPANAMTKTSTGNVRVTLNGKSHEISKLTLQNGASMSLTNPSSPAGSQGVYKVMPAVRVTLLNGHRLCGAGAVTWVAVVTGRDYRTTLDVYRGRRSPPSWKGTQQCGQFSYKPPVRR